MTAFSAMPWTRREWLISNASALVATQLFSPSRIISHDLVAIRPPGWDTLAQHAVDAAKRAGAYYADAHLTRTLSHTYGFVVRAGMYTETIGVGIRALVNGYWGFAAMPGGDATDVERLAQEAVAQAKVNARGLPKVVDLGTVPIIEGSWTMPVKIDPFTVPIEEKLAMIQYWDDYAHQCGVAINQLTSSLYFIRQEQVVATSDGSHFTQTVYESGGQIEVATESFSSGGSASVLGLTPAGKGWEIVLDANIPKQLRTMKERIKAKNWDNRRPKPAQIGRYTLVCDGATMAALLDRTLGVATQLDRALGYEANASGTTYLNDPLEMLGTFKAASPLVTMTANRSAPKQLATVQWDAEGVIPQPVTLIKAGVLVDFQTTREQAAWLAPYYQRVGRPIRSNGCAAVDTGLAIPMQHMPNLALEPAAADIGLEALVSNVKEGILITSGQTTTDFQARTGSLVGEMYEIKNGRVGPLLESGAVQYDSLDLWRRVIAVGGASTHAVMPVTAYPLPAAFLKLFGRYPVKGEPPQFTSYSVQAVAATITNQPLIDLRRKA